MKNAGKAGKTEKKKTEIQKIRTAGGNQKRRKSENNPRMGENDKRFPVAGGARPTSAAKIRNRQIRNTDKNKIRIYKFRKIRNNR